MKRTRVKSKEISKLVERYGVTYSKKDSCEIVENNDMKYIVVNGMAVFFYYEDEVVPTLRLLQERKLLSEMVVDMGAVKFVVNGADIMRPGIVEIADVNEGEYVVIVDENNRKALAVGIALYSGEEMKQKDGGKVIKNIHYVGDELWNDIQ